MEPYSSPPVTHYFLFHSFIPSWPKASLGSRNPSYEASLTDSYVSCSLNSLQGGYIGAYIGDYYRKDGFLGGFIRDYCRGCKGDTRSLDNSSGEVEPHGHERVSGVGCLRCKAV